MSDDKNKDLATEGLTDRIAGTGQFVGGRTRGGIGGAAYETGEQIRAKAQGLKGEMQQAFGKTKRRWDDD